MPVARIYASLVEEAEPICADLLARGYNVEVVFPDAVLPTPADLELRVERCSAEQAIARVEGNDSSRSVFVTRGKGPRNELLLVEMTVLATGTHGRHPIMPPAPLLVGTHVVSAAQLAEEAVDLATDNVLPFPGAAVQGSGDSKSELVSPVDRRVFPQSAHPEVLGRNMMAELNEFLAHAPVVNRPDGLHVRVFENVRQSVSVERARKNWEGLTLAGVAAVFLCLLSLGWYAAPNLPRRAAVSEARPAIAVPATILPERAPVDMASGATLQPAAFKTATPPSVPAPRALSRSRRIAPARGLRIDDDLVAQDQIVRTAKGSIRIPARAPTRSTTTAELIQPAAIRSAPIKHITDLK
jgi:hypothetical protein